MKKKWQTKKIKWEKRKNREINNNTEEISEKNKTENKVIENKSKKTFQKHI